MPVPVAGLALLALAVDPGPAGARRYAAAIQRALPQAGFDFHRLRYTPSLRRLLARDHRDGEVGRLDDVPFCECQDMARDHHFTSRVVRTGTEQVAVMVTLRNAGVKRFVVDLAPGPGGWAISDVHGPGRASLRRFLARS